MAEIPQKNPQMRSISASAKLDWHNGLAEVTVQDGLMLPKTVTLPFLVIKELFANILIGECRISRGMAPAPGVQPATNSSEGTS